MYGWMWSRLPGPVPVRLLISFLFALLLIAVLFLWVFPLIDGMLNIDDSEVSSSRPTFGRHGVSGIIVL